MNRPELYVLRHGETHWNREGRLQGALDSPLTDLGLAQARAMGAALREEGVNPATHGIWSSPQGRAIASTGAMFADLPRLDARLVEIGMGQWAGLTRAEIDARWPGDPDEEMFAFYARCPGGEALEAVWDRASSFIADLTGPAVIVSHGITCRFLRAAALGLGPQAAEAMPGGQGVIWHLAQGAARVIVPPGLPAQGRGLKP